MIQDDQNCGKGVLSSWINFWNILHIIYRISHNYAIQQVIPNAISQTYIPPQTLTNYSWIFIQILFIGKICDPFHAKA